MDAADLDAPGPLLSRHAFTSSCSAGIPIDEFAEIFDPRHELCRWNRFVAAAAPGSPAVSVVAPIGSSSVLTLRGEAVGRPDGHGVSFHTRGGLRGRALRITHEVILSPTGSLRTTIHLVTTWRGPVAPFVSRRRIGEWHTAEVEALRRRVDRKRISRGGAPGRVPVAPSRAKAPRTSSRI